MTIIWPGYIYVRTDSVNMKIIQLLGSKYRANSVLSRWRSGSWVATWYQAMQDLSGKSSKSSLEIHSGDKETSSPAKNWQQQIRDWMIHFCWPFKVDPSNIYELSSCSPGQFTASVFSGCYADAPLQPSLQGLLHEVVPTWQHIPPPPPERPFFSVTKSLVFGWWSELSGGVCLESFWFRGTCDTCGDTQNPALLTSDLHPNFQLGSPWIW